MEKHDQEDAPLGAEAAKRAEWREDMRLSGDDAPGHTLPESENSSASEGNSPAPSLGTTAPPD